MIERLINGIHRYPELNITHFYSFRYVCARPAGKRCFVVSSNGITVSRLRNGSLLHRFPSSLPNGSRTNNNTHSGQSYCILDCIFHEVLVNRLFNVVFGGLLRKFVSDIHLFWFATLCSLIRRTM